MINKISEAELEILKVLWAHPERSLISAEIVKELPKSIQWSDNTVRTLISRLIQKGAVTMKKEGRVGYYAAKISKRTYQIKASNDFLKKVFSGSPLHLVSHFIDSNQLSDQELEELQSMLKAPKKP